MGGVVSYFAVVVLAFALLAENCGVQKNGEKHASPKVVLVYKVCQMGSKSLTILQLFFN